MTDATDGRAVDAFARWHDRHDRHDGDRHDGDRHAGDRRRTGHEEPSERLGSSGSPDASRYVAPVPTTAPRAGEQYRFEVDLDRCTGCKACVSACHSLNGLDDNETWRSVGLLVGEAATTHSPRAVAAGWQQHVTTACHHCLKPACLAGCPVEAYEKDPITGIVAHLDDQCIGCRYCMLTCPYEVPSFNERLGVVRKCDMCAGRLAAGEAPACVQGCPTNAISIGVVDTATLAAELAASPDERLVPTSPRSGHTGPTTVYLSRKPAPERVVAADDHRLAPAHNHPPLVAMLVLTQLSVAAFAIAVASPMFGLGLGPAPGVARGVPVTLAWLMSLVALGASVLHLGRPLVAWRAVLGLRHSWLSREIFTFGAYAPLGGATAAAHAGRLPSSWTTVLAAMAVASGLAGVACSAQLYAVTARPLWRFDRTAFRFGFGGLASGAAVVATAVAARSAWTGPGGPTTVDATTVDAVTDAMAAILVPSVAVVVVASGAFVARFRRDPGALGKTVWLLLGPLRGQALTAISLASGACVVAVVLATSRVGAGTAALWWALVSMAVAAALWIERGLFFTSAVPDRMPGALQ